MPKTVIKTERRKNFSDWEKEFIYLAYPLFQNKMIANILGSTKKTIDTYARRNKLSKVKSVYPGDTFGRWTVLNESRAINKLVTDWKCQCSCEKKTIKWITQNSLIGGKSRSCGCFLLELKGRSTKFVQGTFFYKNKRGARDRGIPFNITINDIEEILIKQDFKCALTGLPILLKFSSLKESLEKCNGSLDRIDNTKGYTKDNVQILHVNANMMKGTFKQDYFIYFCHLISQNTTFISDENFAKDYKKEPNFGNTYKKAQLKASENI